MPADTDFQNPATDLFRRGDRCPSPAINMAPKTRSYTGAQRAYAFCRVALSSSAGDFFPTASVTKPYRDHVSISSQSLADPCYRSVKKLLHLDGDGSPATPSVAWPDAIRVVGIGNSARPKEAPGQPIPVDPKLSSD